MKSFGIDKQAGKRDLFLVLAIATVVEILPVHLLIAHWSPLWSWIATATSAYAAVWLWLVSESIAKHRPIVGDDFLLIQYGALLHLKVPKAAIANVFGTARNFGPNWIAVPRGCAPNIYIGFSGPVIARLLAGRKQPVAGVALAADDPVALRSAIEALLES